MKKYAIDQVTFDSLPDDVKTYIKNTLKAFDEVSVTYENGVYSYGNCIKSSYAEDHKFIGTAYADDFYSFEERMNNYEEEFGSRHPGRWSKTWAAKQVENEVGKVFIK